MCVCVCVNEVYTRQTQKSLCTLKLIYISKNAQSHISKSHGPVVKTFYTQWPIQHGHAINRSTVKLVMFRCV